MAYARRIIWAVCVFVCAGAWAQSEGDRESRLVQIEQGPVRGYKHQTSGVFIFSSIPYATAPTGKDKFKAPLPPPKWQEPYEAVDKGIVCPQFNLFLGSSKTMQEDCLIASVYVPDTIQKNIPVVVYIHGSGFQIGFGDQVIPTQLVKKNVIAVTINHRLGVHGFLCLGTPTAPGNAALKDQLAALRWVKRNIASFGGNPDDITLAGYSGGSVATELMMLSPAARGLFNKAIAESASVISVFTMQQDPIQKAINHAKRISNFSDEDNIQALEDFYTTESYDNLFSVFYLHEFTNSDIGFSPCIERPVGEEIIIDDVPLNMMKNGNMMKIPILYGFANMEGIFRMPIFDQWKDMMNTKFSEFLPVDLKFENEEQKEKVAETVKEFYFKGKEIQEDMPSMLNYIDFFTDVLFAYPCLRSAELQQLAGNKEIYLYSYSFVDVGGNPLRYKNLTTDKGADHCAQTFAVFDHREFLSGIDLDENLLSDEFKKMKETMRELWYNFIVTGKPVPEGSRLPEWPPMGADWAPHMSLGNQVKLEGSLMLERARFWDQIYQQHYSLPKPPSPPARHSELAPLPPPKWQEPYEAVDKGIVCPQIPQFNLFLHNSKTLQEDCLIASVYVPATIQKNLPVVVYIHGSGFQVGFGDQVIPTQLVKKNVIAVTINHRLGVHGFLCLGTPSVPGNAALKDQLAALRWVKRNIASFGGNPDDITLAGYSGGSVAVELMMLSPAARGLFNKAIAESASSLSVFTMQQDPIQKAINHAKRISNFSNEDNIQALEDFYTTESYDNLFSVFYLHEFPNSDIGFSPCIERAVGEEIIIDDVPVNMMKNGNMMKIPILYGFANMEGIFRMPIFDQWKDMMNTKFSEFLPVDLKFENEAQKEKVAETVKEFYFKGKEIQEDMPSMLNYIDFFTDVLFAYPCLRSAELQQLAGNKEIYLYSYSFVDVGGNPLQYKNLTTDKGADHCAQTFAVFDHREFLSGIDLDENLLSDEFKKMKETMRELWYNFIVTGKPVPEGSRLPEWPPMGADWAPHMSLGNQVKLEGSLMLERARFWDQIYQQHYSLPKPPSPPPRHSEL